MGDAAQRQRSHKHEFGWVPERSPVLAFRCACDPALTLEGLEGPAKQLFGREADGLIGHSYAALVDERDREDLVEALLAAARSDQTLVELGLRLAARDASGRVRWVAQRTWVVRDAEGKGIAFEGLLIDDSARKRLELNEGVRRQQRQFIIELATHPDLAEGRFDELSQRVSERLSEICDIPRASVWLLNEARDELICVSLYVRASRAHSRGARLSARDYPAYFAALHQGLTIDAADAAQDPRTCEFADSYLSPNDICSMLDAALLVAGEVAGVVCLEAVGELRRWAQHELEFATEVAAQLSLALLNRGRIEARARELALQDQLLHSNKMEALGRLAGGVAHDFNNALMIISASAELLAGELEDPMLRACAEHIVNAGLRAGELTEHLQSFARRQPLERHPLDLCEQLAKLEPLMRRLSGRGIELVCSLPEDPVMIRASEGLIQQLLTCLVDNARDAKPSKVELSVELVELREPLVVLGRPVEVGRYALLVVSDDGVGMSEEVEARVFEPLFTTKAQGSGIGLATAYSITQRLEGSIKVASELGMGTRFYVFLPALDEP